MSILVYPVSWSGAEILTYNWGIFTPAFLGKVLLVALDIYIVLYLIQLGLKKLPKKRSEKCDKNMFWYAFFMCLSFWSICFLVFFPGAGMNDTINGLMSATGQGNMQPVVFQTYVHYVFKFFQAIFKGNGTISYAFLTMIQMIYCAFCVAYNTQWLVLRHLIKGRIYPAYFCLFPIVANYSITVIKDIPFSFSILVLIPALYDVISGKAEAKQWLMLFLSSFVFWFSRSNGRYVLIVTFVIAIVAVRKNIRQLVLILLALILLNSGVNAKLKSINSFDCSMRESSGILLNQISAVVATGGSINSDDANVISGVLPYFEWGLYYQPSFIDSLKFSADFNNDYLQNHKGEFIKSWVHIVAHNFDTCVKAYVIQTYGLWTIMPDAPRWYDQSIFTLIGNNVTSGTSWEKFLEEQNATNIRVLPDAAHRFLYNKYISVFDWNVTKLAPGVFLIILLVMVSLAKSKPILVVLSIDILIWLTEMISVPSSLMYRYCFYLILTLPLYCVMICRCMENDEEQKACRS